MARFSYRMQSILNLKMKLESQAKMEFGAAKVKLDTENEKLTLLGNRLTGYEEEGRNLRASVLNTVRLRENQEAIRCMQELIRVQERQVELAEQEVEAARTKLQEVMTERKTHEKLKEHAFEEYVVEENRRESKEVDELTSYTYGRRVIQTQRKSGNS